MSDDKNDNIVSGVLSKIKEGHVRMRPRWHFLLRGALFAVGVALVVLTLTYLISLTVFLLRFSGAWFAPGYAPHGLWTVLHDMPWAVVGVSVAFLIILEVLVRRYSFTYKRPLAYSVGGVLLMVLIGGLLVARTSLHSGLLYAAHHGRLPVAGAMYRAFEVQDTAGIERGIVIRTIDDGFNMGDRRGKIVRVIVVKTTKMPDDGVSPGAHVVVFGPRANNVIKAYGVRLLDNEWGVPRPGFDLDDVVWPSEH